MGLGPALTDSSSNTASVPPIRRVRWRRAQSRALLAGALITLVAAIVVAGFAYWQGRKQIHNQRQTRSTHATVTRRWAVGSGPSAQYWVAYRYPELPANSPDQTMSVSAIWWSAMSPGSTIVTHYTPAAPQYNGLMGTKADLFHRWLWTGGVLCLFAALAPFWIYLRNWRRKKSAFWLVRHGKTAVAEITDVAETMVRRGEGARWRYDIEYRFAPPGAPVVVARKVEKSKEQRQWDVGRVVTVFFDPQNPGRHALYSDLPGELVSTEL